MSDNKIPGYCPMGCGETLFRASGGYITCSYLECPEPDAVSTILADHECEHVVDLRKFDFTIRHPLRERLRDELMQCGLHGELNASTGPPAVPGRYRVYQADEQGQRRWELIS